MNVTWLPTKPTDPVLEEGDSLSGLELQWGVTGAAKNFWEMTHWDMEPQRRALSAGVSESWPIYSEMSNFSFWISGTRKRAGSLSDLSLTFVPDAWGSVMEINMHEPPGYDFGAVRPASPLVKEITTEGPRVVVVNGDFRPGILHEVFLGEVILGAPGGHTRISIQMFEDFRMEKEVARKINFLNGFVQPGSATGRERPNAGHVR
eukprot:Skav214460  [mRNA]  locus=scaffold1870:184479:190622:+ [translate_table: standard]